MRACTKSWYEFASFTKRRPRRVTAITPGFARSMKCGKSPVVPSRRGTRDTGVYGADNGQSGVKETRIFFDGDPSNATLTQVFAKNCSYAEWRPCPEFVSDTATINTLAFADGPHTATTRVVDAGGNVTLSANKGLNFTGQIYDIYLPVIMRAFAP